jgi:hypothetical protein
VTSIGTAAQAVDGRASAITVLSPVHPGGVAKLRVFFFLAAHIKALNKALETLSFIHYARWTVVSSIPYNGEPQQRENLHYDYLFFETNFNGTWDEYIDAFSEVVPDKMSQIWGSSYGFPGPQPVGPFKAYIHANDLPVAHYYGAYPDAPTKMVISALRVRDEVARFNERTAGITDPGEFQAAYNDFLTTVQHDI